MKKLTLISALILSVSGLGYYLLAPHSELPDFGLSSLMKKASPALEYQDLGNDQFISNLNDQVFALVSLNPRSFDSVGEALEALGKRIDDTQVGKKYGNQSFSKMLTEEFKQSFEDRSTPEIVQLKDFFLEFWKKFQRLNILISTQSFKMKEQLDIPYIWINAELKEQEVIKKLLDIINSQFPENQNEMQSGDMQVVRILNNNGVGASYNFKIVDQFGAVASGLLDINGSGIDLLFGTDKREVFQKTGANKSFLETEQYKSVSSGVVPDSAMVVYFDYEALLHRVNQIKLALPQNDLGIKAFLDTLAASQLADFRSALVSFALKNAVTIRQCVALKPGSNTGKYFEQSSEDLASESVDEIKFHDLISPQTMLAFQFRAPLVRMYLQQMNDTYATNGAVVKAMQDDQKMAFEEFARVTKKIETFLNQTNFHEFGLRINSASGAPLPGMIVFLGESALSNIETLETIQELLLSIPVNEDSRQRLAQDMQILNAKSDNPALQISVHESFKILITAAAKHSFVIALAGPMIGSGNVEIAKSESFLKLFPNSQEFLSKRLPYFDAFAYINLRTILDTSRPFLPLLLSQQPADMPNKLEMGDIDEIFNLLGVSFFGAQKTQKIADNNYCVDAWWRTLN